MALKILLADDSMTAQNMGKKILMDAGYDVVAVSNGAAAIKKIASDRPDIIILDVYMPGYTGLEVCERVKAANETSRTPVLLTVGKMEPFRPEEANRVKADGVMIKPFEATDLIAAIQSIGQRLISPAPKHVDTVRIAPPTPSLDQTMRISMPPVHQDTVRIASPSKGFEDTVRLSAEQVRAFQDASYKDWVSSAEVADGRPPVVEEQDEPDTAVSSRMKGDLEPDPVEPEPFETRVLETLAPPPQAMLDPDPDPVTPGLDATEAPLARAMAGAMAGHEFFSVAPAGADGNHGQQSSDEMTVESPAMFAHEQTIDLPPLENAQPIFTLEQAQTAEIPTEVVKGAVAESATHELETSAPLTPGPSFVAQLDELEPTVAAPINVVSEAAPELEVNSPRYGHDLVVEADPGLVTNDGDLSQFVTKFGVEGAEEVHVGMASDLPPEQLAALTMPTEPEAAVVESVPTGVIQEPAEEIIVQEVPVLDAPDEPATFLAPEHAPEPVAEPAPVLSAEPLDVKSEAVATPDHTSPMDEVGEIEPDSSTVSSESVVAYVPGLDDTERIAPLVGAPVAYQEPEQFSAPEPVAAVATEVVHEEAQAEAPFHMAHVLETAAAAVAGSGAVAGFVHTLHHEEPSAIESHVDAFVAQLDEAEARAGGMVEEPVEALPEEVSESPVHEPVGDAALAEELAAALSAKESEDELTAAANAATSTNLEPVIAAAMEPMLNMGVPGYDDQRLSEAVARALERLKPQLISEILKELTR